LISDEVILFAVLLLILNYVSTFIFSFLSANRENLWCCEIYITRNELNLSCVLSLRCLITIRINDIKNLIFKQRIKYKKVL